MTVRMHHALFYAIIVLSITAVGLFSYSLYLFLTTSASLEIPQNQSKVISSARQVSSGQTNIVEIHAADHDKASVLFQYIASSYLARGYSARNVTSGGVNITLLESGNSYVALTLRESSILLSSGPGAELVVGSLESTYRAGGLTAGAAPTWWHRYWYLVVGIAVAAADCALIVRRREAKRKTRARSIMLRPRVKEIRSTTGRPRVQSIEETGKKPRVLRVEEE
jgi:hypothetical protein